LSNEDILMETIDRYLNGGMSEQERIAFENRMAIDGDLAAKVEETELVNEAVHYASLAVLREEIGKDIKKIRYREHSVPVKIISFILASLAVAILTIGYFHNNPETTSPADEGPAGGSPATPDTIQPRDKGSVTEYSSNENTTIAINLRKADSDQIRKQPEMSADSNEKFSVSHSAPMSIEPVIVADSTQGKQATVAQAAPTEPIPANSDIPAPTAQTADCEKAYKIKSAPSCRGKATGSISVITADTTTPVLIIDNYSSSVNGVFDELAAGIHTVSISYGDDCRFTENVIIEEKWCPLNKSFSFNPDYGERWEIAYEKGDAGTFSIFTSGGREIYRNTFGQGNEFWAGHDSFGALSAIGTYLVIIQYEDGRTEKAELTIVR